MKINFILPFINKTGGIAVLLEHASGLRRMGHDVAVYYPLLPYGKLLAGKKSISIKVALGRLKLFLGNIARWRKSISWRNGDHPLIPVPWISATFIRRADVVLATAWPTAFSVAALPASRGKKIYFVQSYEVWDWDPALVDLTYRLPLQIITIAPWITELMRTKFSREVSGEVPNGVDTRTFRPPTNRDWRRPSILMLYHEVAVKGARDGLKVLEQVHASFPSVPIVLFGVYPKPELPEHIRYHQDLPIGEIARLYQEATLFLSPSLMEGWQLPPMEAMACACAVVATTVGCIPALYDGANMRVAEPGDIQGLFQHVEALLKDTELCRRTGENGLRTIEKYSWSRATEALDAALTGAMH